MKSSIFVFWLLLLVNTVSFAHDNLDPCPSLEECIERLHQLADVNLHQTGAATVSEFELANKLATFEDRAVERLIPLLEHDNESVVQLAAIGLRAANDIDGRYLPNILKALDADVGWLAPALGKIKTATAAKEAVRRYIGSYSAPHNQEAQAVIASGLRAIPFVISAATCISDCGFTVDDSIFRGLLAHGSRHHQLAHVLAEMPEDVRKQAAAALMQQVLDLKVELSLSLKAGLIYMIGSLGEAALGIEPLILTVRERRPELLGVINHTLISIKSPAAVKVLTTRLTQLPDVDTLRKISLLGPVGFDTGRSLLDLIETSAEQNLKQEAIRALGHIQYEPAVPLLNRFLMDESNIHLTIQIIQSLALLGDKSSIKGLRKIAKSHWHPSVKKEAKRTIKNIHFKTKTDTKVSFYPYRFNLDSCTRQQFLASSVLQQRPQNKEQKLYRSYALERLQTLTYPLQRFEFIAGEQKQRTVKEVPSVALKVEDGWLVGGSRGEWGGELAHINNDETVTILVRDNVKDIHKFGDRYIAVAGLAHMASNRGDIYEISKTHKGWRARPWLALPASPNSGQTWLIGSGELLVNTSGGGTILISQNGEMRMADCRR